jgi:hypothetical protein
MALLLYLIDLYVFYDFIYYPIFVSNYNEMLLNYNEIITIEI